MQHARCNSISKGTTYMSNDNNVVNFPHGDAASKATAALKATTAEVWAEYFLTMARIRRVAYENHIAAGFTAEESLILCQRLTL